MPSNYISYSDFIGANADQIKAMEERLRAAEQAKLQEAKAAMDPAGEEMKMRAFFGETEGGEGMTSYSDWVEAKDKIEAAKQYQADIQNDAGQLNQLQKIGGAYGNMDAQLVFGTNKGEGKGPRVSLGEFMGYDAKELGELAASTEAEAQSFAERRAKELAKRDEMNAKAGAAQEYDARREKLLGDMYNEVASTFRDVATRRWTNPDAPGNEGMRGGGDVGKYNAFKDEGLQQLWADYEAAGGDAEKKRRILENARQVLLRHGALDSSKYGGGPSSGSGMGITGGPGATEYSYLSGLGERPSEAEKYKGWANMTRQDWERENPNKNPWDSDFYSSGGSY